MRTRPRPALVLGLVALLLLLILGALPLANLAATTGGSSAKAAAPAAGSVLSSGSAGRATPHPQFSCVGYPGFGELNGNVWPLSPDFYLQNPCAPMAEDESHLTFSSTEAGSGDRVTVPWYLPPEQSQGQENATAGIYLGMVVTGDPESAWNQSYLEVQAIPTGSTLEGFDWNFSVAVLSFVNESKDSTGCAISAYTSWNFSTFCEFDDLNLNQPIQLFNVSGGSWVQVTFTGTPKGDGTTVYLNQTSGGNQSANVTLDLATTGTDTFNPAYTTACPDECELDWAQDPSTGTGQAYGLGIGIDVCPEFTAAYSYCDGYNGSRWVNLTPTEVGVPHYWTGSGYNGTYSFVAAESTSGVCNNAPPAGTIVATCNQFTAAGGDGFYPYFALGGNGTASYLTYGQSYATTRTDWGGAYGQFLSTPGAQDLKPMVLTQVDDSSLSGYLAPGYPLNVTARATDLGTVTFVNLTYSDAGVAWATLPMALASGSTEDGNYAASIPAGPNGQIVYYVNGTSAAGTVISSGPHRVVQAPIPHFNVVVQFVPPTCGSVTLNGTADANGTTVSLLPGSATLSATGCYPYRFGTWETTGGVTVANPSSASTTVGVDGNGSVTVYWVYVRPYETVTVGISPSGCGSVSINGTIYGDGSSALLPYNIPVDISQTVTCGGDAFAGWTIEGNLTILGTTLDPDGNGTVTASYVTTSSSHEVTFETSPSACGGISIGGAAYTSGESVALASGTFTVAPAPCAHWGFQNWSTSGGVSISGDTLTVSGAGTLTETNYKLTEVFVATTPGGCGGIEFNGTDYTNGADIVVQNHSVYSVTGYSCAGHYLESLTANGGLTLIGSLLLVNGTGTVLVVSFTGSPQVYVGILTDPSTCGGVDLGGTTFGNGGFTTETPDSVLSIMAIPCANYGFTGYTLSGEIAVVGYTVWLNGSGAIQANFGPEVNLLIYTNPTGCGSVLLGGTVYGDGSEATLTEGVAYQIVAYACAYYQFVSFDTAPYVAIANGTIVPTGPSTITAEFVPSLYTVRIATGGSGCGTVTINGAPEPRGAHLTSPFATYSVGEVPCATSTFVGWNVTGNLSVAGARLYVNGSGNLTALFTPTPPTVSIGGPSLGYAGTTVEFLAEVPVPVASSGYTYLWSFGDGTTATNDSSNATTHTYSSPGTYTVSVEVVDPYHRSANATTTITVEGTSAASSSASTSYAILAIGIVALALVVLFFVARRPPRAEAPAAEPQATTPPKLPPPEPG